MNRTALLLNVLAMLLIMALLIIMVMRLLLLLLRCLLMVMMMMLIKMTMTMTMLMAMMLMMMVMTTMILIIMIMAVTVTITEARGGHRKSRLWNAWLQNPNMSNVGFECQTVLNTIDLDTFLVCLGGCLGGILVLPCWYVATGGQLGHFWWQKCSAKTISFLGVFGGAAAIAADSLGFLGSSHTSMCPLPLHREQACWPHGAKAGGGDKPFTSSPAQLTLQPFTGRNKEQNKTRFL
jgi:hypothetical protein